MQITRQQYIELMSFGEFDRPMFSELFGPLVGLPEEWKAQGASPEEIDMVAFDWDYVPYVDCGASLGAFGTPAPEVIEEDDEYLVERDYLGRTTKLCKKTATIPLPMDYPMRQPEDWERLKPYFTFSEARIDPPQIEKAKCLQQQGWVVRAEMPGAWDILRELMGEERACLAMFDWPDLIHDILGTIRETCVACLERVTEQLVIDQLFVHEDMAGKTGPMVGPGLVLAYFKPYYLACWDLVCARGTKLFNQDSDGDMRPLIEAFLECGVNVMHPCEPNAGMDIVEMRKQYGTRVAMLGGIDKFVLYKGKDAIQAELEYKMQPMMQQAGGMVFGLDHRIPNGVPLENYRTYVKLGREILDLPPLTSESRGWGRMAF
ncbi:MAG: uroporphyrinogen decarboxylase family protein [Phycisphaerae bacterium]|nr:uroporphyrinogen decarboxylase family protein [Phycisphaerae bacterium]